MGVRHRAARVLAALAVVGGATLVGGYGPGVEPASASTALQRRVPAPADEALIPTTTTTPTVTPWAAGTTYPAGAIVWYGGKLYRCTQTHTAIVGWEPPNIPALWALY